MSSNNAMLETIPGLSSLLSQGQQTVESLLENFDSDYAGLENILGPNYTIDWKFTIEGQYLHSTAYILFWVWLLFLLTVVAAVARWKVLKVSVCEYGFERNEVFLVGENEELIIPNAYKENQKKPSHVIDEEDNKDDEQKNQDDEEDEDEEEEEEEEQEEENDEPENDEEDDEEDGEEQEDQNDDEEQDEEDKKSENSENNEDNGQKVKKSSSKRSKQNKSQDEQEQDEDQDAQVKQDDIKIDMGGESDENGSSQKKSPKKSPKKQKSQKSPKKVQKKKSSNKQAVQKKQSQQLNLNINKNNHGQQKDLQNLEGQKQQPINNNENQDQNKIEPTKIEKIMRILVDLTDEFTDKFLINFTIVIYLIISFGSYAWTAVVVTFLIIVFPIFNYFKIMEEKGKKFTHLVYHILLIMLYITYWIVNQNVANLASGVEDGQTGWTYA